MAFLERADATFPFLFRPKIKLIFKESNHSIFVINWNVETNESKLIHKKAELRKVNKEKFKAIFRIKMISPLGISNIMNEPTKGKKINNSNIFISYIIYKLT